MGDVDDYVASLPDGPERTELSRLHRLIGGRIPAVGQATKYAMPCYTYRGVPVAAVVVRKSHIAWYPFSGSVLEVLGDRLAGYSRSSGTLRFTAAAPLADDIVEQLLDIRMRHIDERFAS
ncbi:MAG TPA: DUF1801 domain-containing protein [Mycobacterium sp.]|uniref:iron chaperone n=1 Tax=Mycolicibacterium sp. TaxID=2320850 RepID=UPI0025DF3D80|nr:DUF1801 domain-containing protein [Mycolicibacterium sp.]HPX36122.1 DUF1801 domain-containing protein [Mycobacterium sp.]HQC75705.1 DUF1801 domain-containing protein [Mycobacterium sp.]